MRYFHLEWSSAGRVIVPASPSPMLTFFLAGGALVDEPHGGVTVFDRPFVCGPMTQATPTTWLPGTTFISALIEPAAFGRLFGHAPAALRNLPVPLDDLGLGSEGAALAEQLWYAAGPRDWLALLSDWLLRRDAARVSRTADFRLPQHLLYRPTAEIATALGIGVRQLERRYLASYGQTLRDGRRMQRYVRALSQLILRPPRWGQLTRIAMDAGYHDQAHMSRDFMDFMGVSPASLIAPLQYEDDPLLRLVQYQESSKRIVAGGA